MGTVLCFYGADHKVGVTATVQSVASSMCEAHPEKRALLLHLDGRPGFEYLDEPGTKSLDVFRHALEAEVLHKDELIEACAIKKNLFCLRGAENLRTRKNYMVEGVRHLLNVARQTADWVLIDAGNGIDSALTIGSLLHADTNILITTQQKTAYDTYFQKAQQILQPFNIPFKYLIINQYLDAHFLPTVQQLGEQYNVSNCLSIPMSELGWQAELESRSLLALEGKRYKKSIQTIAALCAADIGDYEKGGADEGI